MYYYYNISFQTDIIFGIPATVLTQVHVKLAISKLYSKDLPEF